ncbi:MAG: pyridoxamine 5'-phosphate oxidase family protein [Bryobacterales bacterium]|nr:pyridoxamine 5'-phosphate oxidase family protein [Bryobacterales bacterium]
MADGWGGWPLPGEGLTDPDFRGAAAARGGLRFFERLVARDFGIERRLQPGVRFGRVFTRGAAQEGSGFTRLPPARRGGGSSQSPVLLRISPNGRAGVLAYLRVQSGRHTHSKRAAEFVLLLDAAVGRRGLDTLGDVHRAAVAAYCAVPAKSRAVMLSRHMEIVSDPCLKKSLWDDTWRSLWPGGPEAPNFVQLRLVPARAEGLWGPRASIPAWPERPGEFR